jgi:hypothetical protein
MRALRALPLAAMALALACTERPEPAAPDSNDAPRPSLNTVVTGAAFTTVNEDQDGTGHCKNGNPTTNCNIYDGKEFVWLNGGPSVAYVGDGDYFFAVLQPGGQPGPNDGEDGNLSDDFDDYTDRTFSVSGGTVTYTGPHDFFDNKIRLLDYADTPNPGGVYILAICSLADEYPVDPSDCKYDAFKIHEDDTQVESDAPTIVKDADGTYDNTYTWTIEKEVDKTSVTQAAGSVTFNYTVTVEHDAGTISNVTVTGTITVFNPNVDNITGADITDELSDGTSCTVTDGDDAVLGPGDNDFAYSCDLTGLPQGDLDNKATVTWPEQDLSTGTLAEGSADFTFSGISFTGTDIDESIDVTDTYGGALGTVSVGDDNPKEFTYSRTIAVQTGCVEYDNTATFTTKDTGATGSDDVTVEVCGPADTGALTMGFWRGPNGNNLIKYFCAPSGKTSLASFLSSLGAGSGPFSNAAGLSCSSLLTYANNIFKAASATDMNKMLKAQMLATALDVYFSTTTLGYSTTPFGSGKNQIKPPSAFLPGTGIGGFVMDLTAVCPMVDNTTAGTATCKNNTPSTNAFASGAVQAASQSVLTILNFAATTTLVTFGGPFNGNVSNSSWYAGNRTKQEILKNIFDQINNELAFAP